MKYLPLEAASIISCTPYSQTEVTITFSDPSVAYEMAKKLQGTTVKGRQLMIFFCVA